MSLSPDEYRFKVLEVDTLMNESLDLRNRRIYLMGPIEEGHADKAAKALKYFEANSEVDPIEVYVCSEGGFVELMFMLYDIIRACKAPVHTIGTGAVCSAAVLVLMAGHKRFATENCFLMHHQSRGGGDGDERETIARAEMMKKTSTRCYELLSAHSNKTVEQWQKSARDKGEVWLNAEQMLEWGVVDEIILSPHPEIKRAPKRRRRRKKNDGSDGTPVLRSDLSGDPVPSEEANLGVASKNSG